MLRFIFSRVNDTMNSPNMGFLGGLFYLMCFAALIPAAILLFNLIRARTPGKRREFHVLLAAALSGTIIFLWPNILWTAAGRTQVSQPPLAAAMLLLNMLLGCLAPQARWRTAFAASSAYLFISLLNLFPEIFLGGSLREGVGAILWPFGLFAGYAGWLLLSALGTFLGAKAQTYVPASPKARNLALAGVLALIAALLCGPAFTGRSAAKDAGRRWDLMALSDKVLLGQQAARLSSVLISQDARTAALIGWDKSLRVYDTATHRRQCGARLPADFYFAGLVPGRKAIAAACDAALRLWNLETCEEEPRLTVSAGAQFATPFSNDGNLAATTAMDDIVRIWDLHSGAQKTALPKNPANVASAAFAPGDKMLATGDFNSLVRVWDVETGRLKNILASGSRTLTAVTFSADGELLASGSCDETVRVWDLPAGQLLREFKDNFGCVTTLVFSPDGNTLATSGWFGSQLWDLKTGQKLLAFPKGPAPAFSADSKSLFSGSGGTLYEFAVPTAPTVPAAALPAAQFNCAKYADGSFFGAQDENSAELCAKSCEWMYRNHPAARNTKLFQCAYHGGLVWETPAK